MPLFVIDAADNVATALETLEPGDAPFVGEATGTVHLLEQIERGHKAALRKIPKDAPVIKHGRPIAVAVQDILPGEWVHIHNVESMSNK